MAGPDRILGVRGNGIGHEEISLGSELEVISIALWPICSDAVRQQGRHGARLIGAHKVKWSARGVWFGHWRSLEG
jgi:hypothetical protein